MRERVGVYWVCRAAPCLDLVCEALGVWGCEDADLGRVAKGFRQVVQEGIDGLSDTDWSEDSRAKQRVATESVVENILGSGNVSVHPGQIRQLFKSEGGDGAFVTFSDPFEREVVAVGIQWVWG